MPIYEYQCGSCGQRFEAIQKVADQPLDACRKCGKGPVQRLLSSPAIQFKGSGWYVTDYAKKGTSDAGSSGKPSAADAGSSDTAKKSESTSSDSSPKTDSTAKTAAKD